MTLKEFSDKAFSSPGEWKPETIFVFEDEESMDSYLEDVLNGEENHDGEIAFVMCSDFRSEHYLKEEILTSEVDHFVAMESDTFAVLIEEVE